MTVESDVLAASQALNACKMTNAALEAAGAALALHAWPKDPAAVTAADLAMKGYKASFAHVEATGAAMALAAMKPPTPVEPPLGTYGYDGDTAKLIQWIWKGVTGAGKPAGIGNYAAGQTMRGFLFRPPSPGDYSQGGYGSGYAQNEMILDLLVEDYYVDTYNKWGCRTNENTRVKKRNGTTRGMLGNPSIEHGDYGGVQGRNLGAPGERGNWSPDDYTEWFEDLLFVDIPGQAIQQSQRGVHKGDQECTDPAWFDSDGPPIYIRHVKAINSGRGSDNSGSTFSFFGPQDAVGRAAAQWSLALDVEDLVLDNSMQTGSVFGGFVCQGKFWLKTKGVHLVWGGALNRPAASISRIRDGVEMLEGHYWAEGGQRQVKIEVPASCPITWRGNTGNCDLVINGTTVGPVTKDILP